jgi:hypothetical protein
MNISVIGSNDYGEKCYRVYLAKGTAWYKVFQVYAYNESEAIDMVADYVEENGFEGLYFELYDLCEGETVGEYAEANNLICCGNHGIYLEIAGIELVK